MAANKPSESESDEVFKHKQLPIPKGKLETSLDFMKPFGARGDRDSSMELIVMMTKETQTDWEWADVQQKQPPAIEIKDEPKKVEIDPNKPMTPPPVVTPLDHIRTEGIQTDPEKPKKRISVAIQAFQDGADDVVLEPYLELKMSRSETRIVDTPVTNEKRKHGGATPVQEPWPPRSPLYGRPIMIFDDDDEVESPKKETIDERELSIDGMPAKDGKLPRLGLPGSLQIKKDSLEYERARNREEFQNMIAEPAARPPSGIETGSTDSTFANLVCEFCEKPLRPFPTLEQQRTTASSELYCCDEYRKFVEYVLATDDSFEQQLKNKLLGSEAASEALSKNERQTTDQLKAKIAKQTSSRAALRQTGDDERRHRMELERHMAMLEKAKKMRETQLKDGKNVKTINFQLSKYRCYEEGMVILPADFHLSEMEQFQHRKIQVALAEAAALQQKRLVVDIEGFSPRTEYSAGAITRHHGEPSYLLDSGVPVIKKYEDKQTTFLVLLADGTSTVYYPSGNIAITVSVFNGIRTFIAFDDAPTNETHIVAMFMSSGFGSVYSSDGNVRLSLTPAAGFEANPDDGTKRRRWTWAEMAAGSHIHAPPFQCIFYHLNSYLSVRIGDYQDWTLTFFYKQYRCRFNIMAFSAFEVVDSSAFDMADMRLVRLNKFKSQLSESHNKLKALLREINYMLGLVPASKSGDGGNLTSRDSKSQQSPRLRSKKALKQQTTGSSSGKVTHRLSNSFLPPLTGQSVVEVESK